MNQPNINENILKPKPYVPAKPLDLFLRENNLPRCIKLDANENPFGYSPAVKDKFKLMDFNRYPDGGATILREFLANGIDTKPENIFVSPGSNHIIEYAVRAFLKPGNNAIMADKTFSLYKSATLRGRGEPVVKPLKTGNFNLNTTAKAINDKTDIIFICNPNNPTGTVLERDEFVEFIKSVPKNVLVLVDEAYMEFCEKYATVIDIVDDFPNLVVMRTFSKIYGLAGLRIGYAVSNPRIVDVLYRTMTPFAVSMPALEAAYATLKDTEFVEETYKNNFIERKRMITYYNSKEWFTYPSQANFIYVEIPVDNFHKELEKRGILIRPLTSFGFGKQSFRITIGTPEENSALIKAIETIL